MKGDFPPSSKVTTFRLLLAANSSIIFPVSVDPVKATCVDVTYLFQVEDPANNLFCGLIGIPILTNKIQQNAVRGPLKQCQRNNSFCDKSQFIVYQEIYS